MRASRRAIVVALAPAGTVCGHVLGYVMAGEDAGLHGAHSHLRPAAWAAATAAAVVLAALVAARPALARGGVRLISLVSGQVALFALVEAAEHAAAGHGVRSLVTEPTFRWGVLAQVATGAVLVLAARLARAAGERVRAVLARRRQRPDAPRRRAWGYLQVAEPRVPLRSSVSERGPPAALATA